MCDINNNFQKISYCKNNEVRYIDLKVIFKEYTVHYSKNLIDSNYYIIMTPLSDKKDYDGWYNFIKTNNIRLDFSNKLNKKVYVIKNK